MLAAEVDPYLLRNLSGAHLVATKYMGNGFSHLGTCITIIDELAGDWFINVVLSNDRRSAGGSISWRRGGGGVVWMLR